MTSSFWADPSSVADTPFFYQFADLIGHKANNMTDDDSSLALKEWRDGEAHAFAGTSWLNNKAVFSF